MRVGIYFDLRNPPQWATDWTRLYGFTLEMCEEAERLGCPSVWLSEHHLFEDGYLPQPLTYAAAIAARTKKMRIGTAIVIAPLHHPAELAEQSAAIDILSGGRFDLGIGAGYRIPEFDLFGADINKRYTTTDETARELRRLWSKIKPGPVQPRLPIWMGYAGPQGARRAGLLGEGLLTTRADLWPVYRDALAEAGHAASSGRMAGGINGWVTEDPEADWPVVSRHIGAQFDSYRRHMVEGTGAPEPRPIDVDKLRHRESRGGALDSINYGTPEQMAEMIKAQTAGAPVEEVYLWASVAGMPEPMVATGIQTICKRLAPLLADYDPMANA